MKVPVISARRDRSRKAIETAAIAKTMHAVGQSLVETGTLDPSEVAKSFGPGATRVHSAGQTPGSAITHAATGWTSTSSISGKLNARLQQNLASGFGQAPEELEEALAIQGLTWGPPFPPGRPLDPFFGNRRPPRTFDYPVGANVQLTPRSNRVSFPTLKAIYEAYDVAQICVKHLINDVRSLDYNWEPIPGIKADVADEIEQAIAFFDSPDKRQPFRTWIAEWLQDVLRYDAGALYIRRNEAGDPIALEVISGSTIIPLIDYYGRKPEDEDDENVDPEGLFGGEITPAFVQIIEGLPWDWLAADDLLYQPWNPLPDSQYGQSPLEAVLLSANTDIRFQWHFLNFFTEGTMPAGFMEAPPDMSDPAQIASMQDAWDALMQGDQTKLRQIRWVPSGAKFTEAKPAANKFDSEFPLYLMRRTCASYGVTPNDLGFTENVNRATGDTQIDVQFRVGTTPLLRYVEDVINLFVKQHLKLRVRIRFDDGKETEDRVAAAQAAGIYLDHGVIGIDEVRTELGQPIDKSKPSPRYINNTRVGPIPILALESMAGKIDTETLGVADSQALVDTPFVAAPGVIPPAGSPELKQSAETTGAQANALRDATANTGPGAEGEETPEGAQEGEETPIDKMLKDIDALLTKAETAGVTAATGVQGVDLESEEEEDDDDEEEAATKAAATALALRRWRENSRNRLKKGRAPRKFVDSNLSPEAHQAIWSKLEKAKTRVQVDAAFKASPKAKPARPAFHHNADAIVAHYSPLIAAALGKLYSADAISAAIKAAEAVKGGAKKDATHAPPGLRESQNPTAASCGNCMMFRPDGSKHPGGEGGTCWGYGEWPVDALQLCDSWDRSQERKATKAAEPDPVAAAAAKALEAASTSPKALESALRELYGDGFLQGAHDAAAAAHGSILASLTDIAAQPDAAYWDAWVPGYGEAAALVADGGMADLLANGSITIQGMTDTSIERIGNTISDGLSKGDSYEATAKALEDVTGSRAEVIANTEMNRAMTTASVQTYEAAGIEEVEWLAEADACPECEANADASPYPLDGGEEPPAHPSCFPAGTLVTAEGVRGSTARWFDGELIEIITNAGCLLAVTPNHPILTSEGWVAAGELAEGSNVISGECLELIGALVDPHNYDTPTLIEKVAVALGGTGAVSSVSVPTSPEDFHGDGAGSEISVVRTDSLLRYGYDGALIEPDCEELLGWGCSKLADLAGVGALDLLIERMSPATSCHVCGRSVRNALLPSSARLLQTVSSSNVADRDVAFMQSAGEGLAVGAELASELLDRFPGDVILDPVVSVRRYPFAGHVYNLQTVSGWYIANGILAHNCRCALAPVVNLDVPADEATPEE